MRLARLAVCLLASAGLAACGPGVVWFGKSPDRAVQARILQEGAGQRVEIDGLAGKVYRGIGVEGLAWSPDGGRLAYPARVEGGWVLVVDGREGPVMDGLGEVVWSPDGQHVACAAELRGRWGVVRDGRPEPLAFGAIRARSLRFSADGAHLAYAAEEDGKVVAVADGKKSAPYDAVGGLTFSREGKLAFTGRRGDWVFVVAGGVESEPYEDVADLSFGPSGKLACSARKAGAWRVIAGGEETEPFDRISSVVWAPSGERFAFSAGKGSAERVFVRPARGEPSIDYEGVLPGSLRFDATGAHFTYAARRSRSWYVITDGVESAPYEDLEAPVFIGGGGGAVAHLARRGEATFLVADGNIGPVVADASGLVLAPGGRRFLHLARDGARTAVVEGAIEGAIQGAGEGASCGGGQCRPVVTRTRVHDVVVGGTLVFGAGGARSGYLEGEAASRRLYLVIDGERRAPLDLEELMAAMVVEPDLAGTFTGDSRRLADWVRAEVTLAAAPPRRGGAAEEERR